MRPPEDAIWLPGEETTVVIETGHGGDSVFGGSTSTAPRPPDPTEDRREVEEGEEYDAGGQVESRFRIERVIRPDGSSEFRRTEQFTDGRTLEATGSADAAGNEIDDDTSVF